MLYYLPMYSKIFGIYFIFCLSGQLHAQKHDYNWIFGYGPTAPGFGNSILDFNHSPPLVSGVDWAVNFASCGGSCSDSTGNLMFFTNGIRIYNRFNEVMEGGDTINPGPVWNSQQVYGYVSIYPVFGLPKPSADNIYYLFHSDVENANGTSFVPRLY